jgi:hypothetical protein
MVHALLLGWLLLAPAPGVETVRWGGVAFSLPAGFAMPQKLGLDAVVLTRPAGTTPGETELEIVLAALPREMQEAMGGDDDQLAEYVKTTFLAVSGKPVRTVTGHFLGRDTPGQVLASSIPRPRDVHFFLLPLKTGAKIAIAFVGQRPSLPGRLEALSSGVGASLREESAE